MLCQLFPIAVIMDPLLMHFYDQYRIFLDVTVQFITPNPQFNINISPFSSQPDLNNNDNTVLCKDKRSNHLNFVLM